MEEKESTQVAQEASTQPEDIKLADNAYRELKEGETYKPILVKISPDLPFEQVNEILDYCMLSGVDGIVAGNTTRRRGTTGGTRPYIWPTCGAHGHCWGRPHRRWKVTTTPRKARTACAR